MRDFTITSPEAQPARRPVSRLRDEAKRADPLPRRRQERERREALRQRALVSAWLRALGRGH